MKICFFLQRRFAFVGHNLATLLKEKYGLNDFCGLVSQRSSYNFLKKQQDVNYSCLLLDEEVHNKFKDESLNLDYLCWLEKEFGIPNLWPYLTADRVIMHNQLVREYPYDKSPYTHEEMLRILQVTAKAIISFLEKEKPDIIIFSIVSNLSSSLLYHIARKKGIKTLALFLNLFQNLAVISEDMDKISGLEKNFKKHLDNIEGGEIPQEAYQMIKKFRNEPKSYSSNNKVTPKNQLLSHLKRFDFLLPRHIFNFWHWFFKSLRIYYSTADRFDYSFISPWNYLKDATKRKLRNLFDANDLFEELNPKENFAFFPLQTEPEVSLLVLAPHKTNQLETAKQIAMSLPVGFKLYVKEHPNMVFYRPRSFYKELKKIPNVKIINPTTSSYDIIRSAKLITVATGTVGWEAILLKKPLIFFGNFFYNQLSFVKKCQAFEDLPYLIKEQLENFNFNENELLAFVASALESSVQNTDVPHLWDDERDLSKQKKALEPLADLIAKKLNLF